MSFPRSDAGIPFAGEIAGSSPAMTRCYKSSFPWLLPPIFFSAPLVYT